MGGLNPFRVEVQPSKVKADNRPEMIMVADATC